MKSFKLKKLLVLFLFVCLQKTNAQFFRGVGIFIGIDHSAHKYTNLNVGQKNADVDTPGNFPFNAYYPQSHISHEYFSWGAGIFAELLRYDNVRWQTELEFTHKGALEKEIVDPFIGTRSSGYGLNSYTYIQWNNYLKYYNPIGLSSHWYAMPGVRIEYLFQKSVSVFTPYSGSFPTISFSGNLGLGYEFPVFKNISAFIEYHWNPDIIPHHKDGVVYRNRTFELRIGLMYRPRKKNIDDCNAPRYNGPAY
ncbi:MAG: hypothetical protein ABIP51_15415 [Bacteroidia bacterium]